MILYFLVTIKSDISYNYDFNDISVGVWSGKENFGRRVAVAAKTWFRQFPEVYVFTDYYPKKFEKVIHDNAFPTKVNLIELGDCAKHIWFPTPWERAQPRFIKAMEYLYKYNISKKWFIFADDDSYLVAYNMLRLLSNYNSSEVLVLGRPYCSWKVANMESDDIKIKNCLFFPQGGAGIVISNSFFNVMIDKLVNCNQVYNQRNFAASMRFARCSFDNFGDDWLNGKVFIQKKYNFFSSGPYVEIYHGATLNKPCTFHHLRKKWMIEYTHYGIRTEWISNTNQSLFIDWSLYTGSVINLYDASGNQYYFNHFGYTINTDGKNSILVHSTSQLNPIFSDDDKSHEIPIGFHQEFSSAISIFYHICSDLKEGQMVYDHTENIEKLIFYVKIFQPKIERYQL